MVDHIDFQIPYEILKTDFIKPTLLLVRHRIKLTEVRRKMKATTRQ